MKRQNGVILDGVLARLQDARASGKFAAHDAAAGSLLGTLISDASQGSAGRHAVLFRDRLAAEVQAFAHAAGTAIEVTVWGYLLGNTAVVADRVTFHVASSIRSAAAAELRKDTVSPLANRRPYAAQG